ncbi:MAG: oligosaccharide flippase family protein [Minisyncoccales bacterium]
MKYSFSTNTLTTLVTRILSAICSIAVSISIARFFGPEGNGAYSLAVVLSSVATTCVLFGLTTATVFCVGKNKYPLGQVIAGNVFLSLAAGALGVSGILLAGIFFDGIFGGMAFLNIVLAIAAVPLALGFNLLSHILIGLGNIRAYNRISLSQSLVLLVLVLALPQFLNLGISAAILAYAVSFFIADILFVRATAKEAGGIDWRLNRDYIKDVFSYGLKIYPSHIFSFLSTRVNFFLINAFLNPAAVGLYSIAVALSEGLLIFAKSVSTVLISRVVSETDPKKLKEFTPLVYRSVIFVILPAVLILALVARPLILLAYSVSFADAVEPLRILLIGVIAYCGWEILSNDICGRGRQAIISHISAAAFFAGIIFNVFFISRWGIIGAAWAADATYCLMFFCALAAYKIISKNNFFEIILPKKSDIGLYRDSAADILKKMKP